MNARTWRDGTLVDVDEDEWARMAGTFLGVGFRLSVPPAAAAVAHAAGQARAVAAVFDAALDEVPWAELPLDAPVEVVGGWQRSLSGGLGPPCTRVSTVTVEADATAPARTLPWRRDVSSPTVGLPMLSRLADHQAGRWLAASGGGVGLWLDHDGLVVTTTAGLVLRHDGAAWQAVGPPRSWAAAELARRLGAVATGVHRDELAGATVCAVSDLGAFTVLDAVDEMHCPAAPDAVRELTAARATLLRPPAR